ncbi:hypothetical protein HSB1_35180 [Halogranum salarium B-1]|uniref:Uncharacterized protein n=1 Tax=Halogranum salarium B-1 TaxID=1210908 RepID=J3JE67_9EURY|nr:hypothetical protein HSB1_35180 [Halogranum salarium B-1]
MRPNFVAPTKQATATNTGTSELAIGVDGFTGCDSRGG